MNIQWKPSCQSDTGHSNSSHPQPSQATNEERIELYRTCLRSFDEYVEKHLDTKSAGWSSPSSADGYFSLIPYANYVGRHDWSLRLLGHVAQCFVSNDIPLQQNDNRDQMISYVPSWLAWGASDAGVFDLSNLWLNYATSFQDHGCGGFFSGVTQRKSQSGPIDFDSTTMTTIALARAGRVQPCVKGGEFILQLCQAQPNPEEQFFTAWSLPVGLLTNSDGEAPTTVLRWADPQQHYYKIGLLVVALAHVYGATDDPKYLQAAVTAYHDTVQRAADLWTNTISHKMCWAATTLFAITRENQYLHHACRFADHLISLQQSDGGFTYPELLPAYPPERWEVIPNIGAQFSLWIARTLKTLEATRI